MHLTSARDYLIRELDCVASDPALAWEIDQDAAHALEVLKRKTLVIADAASGLRVLKASDIIGIDPRPADQILAYTRRIVAFSLADHYRHIGEPLAHRELPSLVLGQLSEAHRTYHPLEKVFLHACYRPCECPFFEQRATQLLPPLQQEGMHSAGRKCSTHLF